jgi:predicted Zn-dependent protease
LRRILRIVPRTAVPKQEQALNELQALVNKDPADRMARSRYVAALVQTGKTAQAKAILSGALKRSAKDTDALIQRSALSLQDGKAKEAEMDLHQVLQYRPDSADAHRLMARIHKDAAATAERAAGASRGPQVAS